MSRILWRRLDSPGHDACRLVQREDGWRIQGSAAFQHEVGSAALTYELDCDGEWRTRTGTVNGWVSSHHVDLRITRGSTGIWTLNGEIVPDVEECVDLDFGFTPATNLSQLRRIALPPGESADVPVAWLEAPSGPLQLLRQRYARRTHETYWYESPQFGYAALLRVNSVGFVEQYPGLWEAER